MQLYVFPLTCPVPVHSQRWRGEISWSLACIHQESSLNVFDWMYVLVIGKRTEWASMGIGFRCAFPHIGTQAGAGPGASQQPWTPACFPGRCRRPKHWDLCIMYSQSHQLQAGLKVEQLELRPALHPHGGCCRWWFYLLSHNTDSKSRVHCDSKE